MKVTSIYPGTVGEIVQGKFKEKDVLISCPVNLMTKVTIFESMEIEPLQSSLKTQKFLINILKRWHFEEYIKNMNVVISSNIPRGKGFASSTADLCAAYYALLKMFNKKFNEKELIEECIKIEPTDSILFDKITVFDYKGGTYKETLGEYLKFYLLVFEGKGTVETVEFNNKKLEELRNADDLIIRVKNSLKNRDIKGIGEAALESIMRNENRLKYDILPEITRIKDETGGLGIIGAHSGNVLAIVYDDFNILNRAKKKVREIKGYKTYILETLNENEMKIGVK
ncbi:MULTISPECIES: kinase [Clostridium]|uniref:GHMP family kinase ATP-binding protein n=1 Tax=Clostridium TaxID=1485 RepID=UPI00082506C4|nr:MULTISPECIES: kinase [Clostridium]PJI07004.1 kinase [Clostridium sp. CT7]